MDLERLTRAIAPVDVLRPAFTEISDLAYDTRAVRAGALFFCVPGMRVDGHEFAGEAVARGAAALVVERPLDASVPQLVVEDARAAMAIAADEFFGRPTEELRVAAVTGTQGKTTTVYLLHAILEAAGLCPGLVGTIETRVGGQAEPSVRTTPESIDLQRLFRRMLEAGDRSCALEASSHGSELRRLDGVRFSSLAFTNLTPEHLDLHGTMERYFAAKRRLFTPETPAAVNVDDAYGRRLAEELRSLGHERLLTFGLAEDAELRPDDVQADARGIRLTVDGVDIESSLRGRFNAWNLLAALASARLLGLPDDAVRAGIARVAGVPGRFEPVDEGQPFAVLVDYSHKPDALASVLSAARELADGRVICVFGCGGDRDRAKRPKMGRVAAELADFAILTSDNPRSEDPAAIAAEVLAGAPGLDVELDRAAAITRAVELAEPGDVVVIAGKGHETVQELAGRTIPFDDREAARAALRRLKATA